MQGASPHQVPASPATTSLWPGDLAPLPSTKETKRRRAAYWPGSRPVCPGVSAPEKKCVLHPGRPVGPAGVTSRMLCSMTASRREKPTRNLDRSPPLPSRLLNVGELAERLGVTERHVRRLVHERRIPFVKWGHLVRFDPHDVAEWLDSARVDPIPATPLLDTVRMDRFGRPDRRSADLGRSQHGQHSPEAKRTVRGPLSRRRQPTSRAHLRD